MKTSEPDTRSLFGDEPKPAKVGRFTQPAAPFKPGDAFDHGVLDNGIVTSKAAAASLADQIDNLRDRVLAYVRTQGERGATCWEVEQALGLSHQTASPIFHTLKGKNRAVPFRDLQKAGDKRPTESGRLAFAWKALAKQEPVIWKEHPCPECHGTGKVYREEPDGPGAAMLDV